MDKYAAPTHPLGGADHRITRWGAFGQIDHFMDTTLKRSRVKIIRPKTWSRGRFCRRHCVRSIVRRDHLAGQGLRRGARHLAPQETSSDLSGCDLDSDRNACVRWCLDQALICHLLGRSQTNNFFQQVENIFQRTSMPSHASLTGIPAGPRTEKHQKEGCVSRQHECWRYDT